MTNKLKTKLTILLLLPALMLWSQKLELSNKNLIDKQLNELVRAEIKTGRVSIDSIVEEKGVIHVYANGFLADYPLRTENLPVFYNTIKRLLPTEQSGKTIKLYSSKQSVEELALPAISTKKKRGEKTFATKTKTPLIRNLSTPYTAEKGLTNRHIAVWQSHGYYFEPKLDRWEWQRARIFQTVEDLYTQSYVLPYLVPMLENAGANVLLPRERDTQKHEVIVDNDAGLHKTSDYVETIGDRAWENGNTPGFAHLKTQYVDFENPFKEGTFRQTTSIRNGNESTAEWIPDIPEGGKYAVYVSYKTLPKSTDEARYTVFHAGGQTEFLVNQQMGSGTWIYLGHFRFEKGKNKNGRVQLSNLTKKRGEIITADGVKFGGGTGNIARKVADEVTENTPSSQRGGKRSGLTNVADIDYQYQLSNYPRYTEAARYWMQWAGVPDYVYSDSKGINDYTDDYKSRGLWVNYISGGSEVNPKQEGLNIPIDLSMAFHTDAGTTQDNTIIGTLSIYYSKSEDGVYPNGASRMAARYLNDFVQTEIVDDIKALYDNEWVRRGMWDKAYFEASSPRVPAILLELLSHQNFADMRYGLDPRFRFTVSRSIYKGMLKFIASQNHTEYVVQPLPINNMRSKFISSDEVELSWDALLDPLEPTAAPDRYVVYTRVGDGDFDNGVISNSNSFRTKIEKDVVVSFKVTALNEGGESFPSEILSVGKASREKGTVLVINGFERISAPADFDPQGSGIAGFLDDLDHGVPYINDYKYIGKQKEFRRSIPWMDDDASGFGDSYGNYETMVIAGNTFDYPALHGKAIMAAGFSFVSTSSKAVESGYVNLNDYAYTDLILGKQKQSKMGPGGKYPLEFKTFTSSMQRAITDYLNKGGNLFVSGAFIATDLWDNPLTKSLEEDKNFTTDVLKFKWRVGLAAIEGGVKAVTSAFAEFDGDYNYHNKLNTESYVVEAPDAIEPADDKAFTIFRYSENNLSAGVAYSDKYKVCALGFPFESLKSEQEQQALMQQVLDFFINKQK